MTKPAPGPDHFARRHVGPDEHDITDMLKVIGTTSLEELIDRAVPPDIRLRQPLDLPAGMSEPAALAELRRIADLNRVCRSYLGQGYYDTVTPAVIQRNILENPGWYTAYTPYQAEISQGRLEALLNFQTLIADLTNLPLANASLLDEATAAAEALAMSHALWEGPTPAYFVSSACHPQTLAVIRTRARAAGVKLIVGDHRSFTFDQPVCGALVQYPATDGVIYDYRRFIEKAHAAKTLVTVAADLLALTLLVSPGELGADIAVGSTQRFGVPMGFGGPHAAYFSTREEFKRHLPGRIVGVSHDAHGRPALRLALQTREQHIRREKATSNICTAEVLPAVLAAFYAIYHGPEGLKEIAKRIHTNAVVLAKGCERLAAGASVGFDTVGIDLEYVGGANRVLEIARKHEINLRIFDENVIGISLDELTNSHDIEVLWRIIAGDNPVAFTFEEINQEIEGCLQFPEGLNRTSAFLTHPVFNRYHSEHELLRYIKRLEAKDLSLTTSMIPLGSCTMKLNAAAEMLPITWPGFARLHPFAPPAQTQGYQELFRQLEAALAEITGFAAVSLQPNAGSQGEFAGLTVIRKYHESRGETGRKVCLIPTSAHGTNPASAVLAGFQVVAVTCNGGGDIDLVDLEKKAAAHAGALGALMITYPSTHGVFEARIRDICALVHRHGGQVYMDGANMNAQVGLCRPGDIGADVCHLNLHKTFCIPHGGGGPGVGPIAVAKHLAAFLPSRGPCLAVLTDMPVPGGNMSAQSSRHGTQPETSEWLVAAAPYGSASILPISWMYIKLMGAEGLAYASQIAILNANYIARRLAGVFPVLYQGKNGCVAHECILDMRALKPTTGIDVNDVAKRLMDYGFHAPTMSWPVVETMMVEPTESESKEELDRFCAAMTAIHAEIEAVRTGQADRQDNLLKNAPHTALAVTAADWKHVHTRQQAAFPAPWLQEHKYWPSVGRIDNVFGDRNLVCTC